MKKIAVIFLLAMLGGNTIAQDKAFRFGLKIDPTISWLKPDNPKKFEKSTTGFGFGFGATGEIGLTDNFSLTIGAGLSFEKAGLSYSTASSADTIHYALNNDDELQPWTLDSAGVAQTTLENDIYWLQSRTFNVNYVYLPVALKMKTKEIGMMTYYGRFGLDIKVKTKARATDKVKQLDKTDGSYSSESEKSDINVDKGVQPLALGLNIGFGTEYNLSGSTSLVMGVAYVYGLTNVLDKDDETLVQRDNSESVGLAPIEQKAAMHQIRITLGVLF